MRDLGSLDRPQCTLQGGERQDIGLETDEDNERPPRNCTLGGRRNPCTEVSEELEKKGGEDL
jgi:hypothetical protein